MLRATILTIACLAATSALCAETPCAVPASIGDGWEIATPEASGFDAEALCRVLAAVGTGDANIHGVVVERHGRLVAELYRRGPDRPMNVLFGFWNPFGGDVDFAPTTQHDLRSVSKSIVSLLVGIAIQHGEIASVATPVLDFYPEFAALRSPERSAITLEHLLTMSSGLAWDEGALPNDETRLYWKSDPYQYVLSRPIVAAPGRSFHYDSGGTAVLADILARRTAMPLHELARTELFEPLGITDWEWVADPRGRDLAFTGLRMRPRDLAKIGRMLQNGGAWNGRAIVPAAWIADSLRPRIATGLPPNTSDEFHYGYQWWMGSVDWQGKQLAWKAGFGNGGQRLFLLPELDLSVVVTAGAYGSEEIIPIVHRLFGEIVATVRQ
jgi:CubicO group peptidase (beta-lactamase class C family)